MREMLQHETFESFRAPTLDTLFRLHETAYLALSVRSKRIKSITINPAIEELIWSLKADPIAAETLPDVVEQFTKVVGGLKNPNPAQTTSLILQCENLRRRIDPIYIEELKGAFTETFSATGQRNRALKVCQYLLSNLINTGYDRRYILQKVNERFFSKDIKKIEKRSLDFFIRQFDGKRRDFDVYVPVTKTGHTFVDALQLPFVKAVATSEISEGTKNALSRTVDRKDYPQTIRLTVERLDPFGAHEMANELMQSLQSLTLLQKEVFEFRWSDQAFVTTKRSQSGQIISKENFVLQRSSERITKARGRALNQQARSLILSFDHNSMERVIRATGTVSLAREANNTENQLVLLWSSIEALLSDPPEGVPRITHYLDSIIPSVCLNYPRRYLCAVMDQAFPLYKDQLRKYLKEIEIETDDYPTKFAHFVIDPKYQDLQDRFSNEISDNPLALFRFWKLYSKFRHGSSFHQTVTSHQQRVEWQIARIYRIRNDIVHAGNGPRYTRPIALNAFEYFKTSFGTIVGRASKTDVGEDIGHVVGSILFDYSIFISKIEPMKHSETPLSGAQITELFSKR